MPPEASPDDALILRTYQRSGSYLRGGTAAFAVLGLVLAVGFGVKHQWGWMAFGIAFCALAGLKGLSSARKHGAGADGPVITALLQRPDQVARIEFRAPPARYGLEQLFLRVVLSDGQVALLKPVRAELMPLTRALATRCPKAHIEVPGFARD